MRNGLDITKIYNPETLFSAAIGMLHQHNALGCVVWSPDQLEIFEDWSLFSDQLDILEA